MDRPNSSTSEDTSASRGVSAEVDPSRWVQAHGDALYRYALLRVRRPEVAEDLVQETLLAAMHAKGRFEGQSAERTWLIGILRNKLMDRLRARSRGAEDADQSDWLEDFFDEKGNWRRPPHRRVIGTEGLLEQEEFWEVFDRCLDELSPRAREAFARRVMEQEETSEICKALGVTATNLYVILYRARTQLRHCLMLNWFNEDLPDGRQP